MKRLPFYLFTLVILALSSCQNNDDSNDNNSNKAEESESATGNIDIYSPDEKVASPADEFANLIENQSFEIDASKDVEFTTNHGMKVRIPKGSLVDQEGNQIEGEATVNIKEYYSAGEIILSGIPMHYSDGKNTYSFESDGMFTMTAKADDKDLGIKEGSNITLITKRAKSGEGFEFYELDDKSWKKDASNSIEAVTTTGTLPVLLKPEKPVIIEPLVKFNPNYYTVENDKRFSNPDEKVKTSNDLIKQIDIDVNENPWILDRSKWEFPRRAYGYILKKTDTEEFDTIRYHTIYAVRGNKRYEELVISNKEKKEKYARDLKAYEENFAARQAAGQLSDQELAQELLVSRFGTYNIDRYYSQPPQLIVEKQYKLAEPQVANNTVSSIFLVVKKQDGSGVIPVSLTAYPDILRFNKREANAIVVLANQKFYGLKKEDFKTTVSKQIRDNFFNLKLEEISFASVGDFDNALNELF